MNEDQVINLLINQSVSAGRIAPVISANNADYPYTVYTVIRGYFNQDLRSNKGKKYRYSFTTWVNEYPEAVQIVDDFRAVLKHVGTMAGEPIIDQDPDTKKFRIINNDWQVIDTQSI